MINFDYQFTVNASPQEVFDLFTDPTRGTEWRESAVSGVGSTIKALDKVLGRDVASTQEITAWDPPNKNGFKGGSGPMTFELTTTFEAHDNGTKVTVTLEAESGGFFKIAENLFAKQMKKQLTADMAGLQRVLES